MYFIIMILCIIYWVIYGNLIGGCLTASLFLVLFFSICFAKREKNIINLSMEPKERIISEEEKMEMIIELTGKLFRNSRYCEVEYIVESSLGKKKEKRKFCFLWGKSEIRPVIIDELCTECDFYRIRFTELKWKDLTGLYAVKKTINNVEDFLVMPKKFSMENMNNQYQMKEEQQSPFEYDGIRAYHPGDKLSRIHWKIFAGKGDLFVRESGEEKSETVNIVLSLRKVKQNQYSDYFSTFYSVAQFFLDHNIHLNIYFGNSFMKLESIDQYEELFTKIFCEDLWVDKCTDEADGLQIFVSKGRQTVEDYAYDMEI